MSNRSARNIELAGLEAGQFDARVRELLTDEPELVSYFKPMLRARRALCDDLAVLDRMLLEIVRDHRFCGRLMTTPGIEQINALPFANPIDNAHSYKKPHSVRKFLGLSPTKYASGEIDCSGDITKHGDTIVREYLFEAAQPLLARVKRPARLKPGPQGSPSATRPIRRLSRRCGCLQ